MSPAPVSIIVVSRGRPDALTLCLSGIGQLDHPNFEVIVVTCPRGQAAVEAHPLGAHVKLVAFDEPNISVARNLGIAQAAGAIVAFIDDDAVPEPSWLRNLTGPFDDDAVVAAGGYVRGRNGISFQWRARTVDATGCATPLDIDGDAPVVPDVPPGHAVKTEGTNMALRRDVLAAMGGFDPALRFYLDETELNMRLAQAGHRTAIVPLAQVHHGFAASDQRARDRTPRDLTQIGASLAVYLRKHAEPDSARAEWARFAHDQRLRLLRAMQRGPLGPDDVLRLMAGLRRGWADGQRRELGQTPPIPDATAAFKPCPGRPDAPHVVLSGRSWQRQTLQAQARQAVADGAIVTVLRFSPTALYHRMRFDPGGFWEQTGGQFGRSDRSGAMFHPTLLKRRAAHEIARLAGLRDF